MRQIDRVRLVLQHAVGWVMFLMSAVCVLERGDGTGQPPTEVSGKIPVHSYGLWSRSLT